MSFQRNKDDDELIKLIELEEKNIQDGTIVKAKITLKEAHSFDKELELLYYTTNLQINFFQDVQHFNPFLTFQSRCLEQRTVFFEGTRNCQMFHSCK